MSNIAIANVFLFLSIMSMALSAQSGLLQAFILSTIATVFAGAMRHSELAKTGKGHR